MILSDTAIRHRVTVFVLMLIVVVTGGFSYATLPRESRPDVQIPYVIVTTTHSGVAPADIETAITLEIEKKLAAISGVEEIRSTSREGVSSITVEFAPSTDIDDALQKVRDKVDEVRPELPDDVDEPTVSEINTSEFPIMLLNLSGSAGLPRLKEAAEDLEDEIEKIDGVLDAQISGALTRQIRVEVDPQRLAAYGIPIDTLLETISSENQNVSGGAVDIADAEYSVRVEGEFASPSELFDLILMRVNGRPIYLSDLARVRDTFEDRQTISRFNGRPSVTVSVVKRAGKNIVRIAEEVKEIVRRHRRRLPTGSTIDVTLDESEYIHMMISDLENNVLTGFLLVVAVLMVVMGLRNSVLVALAIPFSMLITFAVLQGLGITLNMVVLFSLILVLGMLVDNAIVIVENIYRHMEEGRPRIRAAMEATGEVAWPVITSGLTTMAAFLPLLFWPGIMGEFMGFLPKTVIIALAASLVVALVINPTLSSVLVHPKTIYGAGKAKQRPESRLVRAYKRMLGVALRSWVRPLIVLAAFAALVGSAALFYFANGKVEFFPQGDPRQAQIEVSMPVGTRLEATDAVVENIERVVRKYQQTDGSDPRRNIEYYTTDVGVEGGGALVFDSSGGKFHKARILIEFIDFEKRRFPSMRTVERLRRELRDMPGVDVKVEVSEQGPPTGKPVEIEISGDEYDRLVELSEQVKEAVRAIPGVTDLDDDYDPGKPELRVAVDRQRAALLGLSTGRVAHTLKGAINGLEVGTYREGDEEYDIVVRLPEPYRAGVRDIEALTVAGPDGQPVPLSAVGRIRYTAGLAAIQRVDEERTITVSSDVSRGYNSNEVLQEAERRLQDLDLPPGYDIRFAGEKEEQLKAMRFLSKAGIAAVLLIGLILVTQFNSVLLPIIILTSVVLSWIGVFLGLTVTGKPFGVIMTGVGMISLAGVVVNNSIVLIDYMEKLRDRGLGLKEAVVEAGVIRLRPVLLTATTTILALMPMVLGINLDLRDLEFHLKSESSVWWGPMAAAVVFGLAVATLLTLVLVPVMYMMIARLRAVWERHFHDEARDAA